MNFCREHDYKYRLIYNRSLVNFVCVANYCKLWLMGGQVIKKKKCLLRMYATAIRNDTIFYLTMLLVYCLFTILYYNIYLVVDKSNVCGGLYT